MYTFQPPVQFSQTKPLILAFLVTFVSTHMLETIIGHLNLEVWHWSVAVELQS